MGVKGLSGACVKLSMLLFGKLTTRDLTEVASDFAGFPSIITHLKENHGLNNWT